MAIHGAQSSARSLERCRRMLAATFGALATGALVALSAQAQSNPQSEDAGVTEVVVTGSRLARPDLTATSPVAVIGAEDVRLTGTVNVESLLTDMPQVAGAGSEASNFFPAAGAATTQLRNLGSNRTLVLVNGRRYLTFDASQLVDLNTIPAALIQRVDVVSGGASAVYGSDAVAGVVNFIMKNDFEGFQADAQYRITDRGDGGLYSGGVTFGSAFAEGNGSFSAHVGYTKREKVLRDARDYSRNATADTFDAAAGRVVIGNGGSTRNLEGRIFVPAATLNAARATLPAGDPRNGALDTFGATGFGVLFDESASGFRAFRFPDDLYNFNPVNALIIPQERWLGTAAVSYEINDYAEVFSELQFARNHVEKIQSPVPGNLDLDVDVDSPFLPADSRSVLQLVDSVQTGGANVVNDGFARVNLSKRFLEVGPLTNIDNRDAIRVLLGLQGELGAEWRYETYASYAETQNAQRQLNQISVSRWRSAMRTSLDANGNLRCDPSGNPAPGCVPLDVFGEGSISQAAGRFVGIPVNNFESVKTHLAHASVTGSLFDIAGRPLRTAIGVERRTERSMFAPDQQLQTGDLLSLGTFPAVDGAYGVTEVFAEAYVPLLHDLPFVHSLDVNLAGRLSDYSLAAVGEVTTWAGGIAFQPVEPFTIRAQYQRAVRAPNVGELFSANSTFFAVANDPCSDSTPVANQTPALRDFCIASGVPAASVFTSAIRTTGGGFTGISGGNPDLTEELSDTYTAGFVFRPTFAPGLNLALDYYEITIEDAIAQTAGGAANIVNLCYGRILSTASPVCSLITRNSVGVIDNVRSVFANIAQLETSGVDIQADYSRDVQWGLLSESSRMGVMLRGLYLIDRSFEPIATLPDSKIECDGKYGLTCGEPDPKRRFLLQGSLKSGPLTLLARYRWLDSVTDDRLNATTNETQIAVSRLPSYSYVDLTVAYDFNETVSLTVGAENVLDELPEITASNQQQANVWPNTYDPLGRKFFVTATARF